jgi:ribose 5-phosphate isomerase A
MDAETYKRAAAARALDYVRPGMRLGLGTGSTAKHFVDLLGERVRAGLDVVAVPTSEATHKQALACGIRLTTLDETPELNLTIDGADEIAPDLTLIKGGGGALLREKIVASASAQVLIIADETKCVDPLGKFALPIEIAAFGATATQRKIRDVLLAAHPAATFTMRKGKDGLAFVTDGGHWIVDAALGRIEDARAVALALNGVPGVMEHGLFIDMASVAVIGAPDGVRLVERS